MKSGDQAKDDPAGGKAEGDKEEPDAKRQKTDAKPHVPRSWSKYLLNYYPKPEHVIIGSFGALKVFVSLNQNPMHLETTRCFIYAKKET